MTQESKIEKLEHPVKAAIFIGTPIGVRPILDYDRDNSFSGFGFDWNNIINKAKHFLVFQSDDNPYVSLGNGEQLLLFIFNYYETNKLG